MIHQRVSSPLHALQTTPPRWLEAPCRHQMEGKFSEIPGRTLSEDSPSFPAEFPALRQR